jgi:hypothetical protein
MKKTENSPPTTSGDQIASAASRIRMQIMENLSEEGRAIYESLTATAVEERVLHKQEVSSHVARSVNMTVDAAMTRTVACVAKATTDMHDYSDGVESAANCNLEALRHQLGHLRRRAGVIQQGRGGRREDRPRWAQRSTNYTEAGRRAASALHTASGQS